MQVGRWSSRDGVVMNPRKPVYWLSGSVAVPKDSSAVVENTTIRVVTVIVSILQFDLLFLFCLCFSLLNSLVCGL